MFSIRNKGTAAAAAAIGRAGAPSSVSGFPPRHLVRAADQQEQNAHLTRANLISATLLHSDKLQAAVARGRRD